MRKTIFFMSIFFLFMVSSCNGFYQESFYISDEESITLQLPSWPPSDSLQGNYPPLSRWIISIESEDFSTTLSCPVKDNGIIEKPFSKNDISFSNSQLSLKVKKNKPLAITAQPITKGSTQSTTKDQKEIIFFKPAGFLYPYDISATKSGSKKTYSKNYQITWEQGFLASLMQNIFKNKNYEKSQLGVFISQFNWKKASEIIEKKLGDKTTPYNPWLLNQARLIEKICSRKASSIYFNMSYTESVPLEIFDKISPLAQSISSAASQSENFQSDNSTYGNSQQNNPTHTTAPAYISSFIPENDKILSTREILLKKQQPTLIYTTPTTGIICTYSSIKKISLEYIFLPIYIEGI